MLAVPIDVALLDDDFSVVRTNLVSIVEEILEERPELRTLLAPDDGAHEEARTLRNTCQQVLETLEASEAIPENVLLQASNKLMNLFELAIPRESQGKLVFVARTLHAAYQRASAECRMRERQADAYRDRNLELTKEIARLRREALDATAARRKDAERIRRLVKLNSAAAEAGRILETQADALRRKKRGC